MSDHARDELIAFITHRLQEIRRLSFSMAASKEINIQASIDQLQRLTEAIESVVTFTQYYQDNPLGIPLLRKIANNWSYHSDFNPEWKPQKVIN